MDRIRNNSILCFLVALLLIIGMMPMTGTAFAAGEPAQVDESLIIEDITRISITADLHLLGNVNQNNRDRLETYLKGIQSFEPDILILCGDQYEGLVGNGKIYTPPGETDYSSESGIGVDFTNPYDEIRAITDFYLPGVEIVFIRGNNDYNTGNDYDTNAGFGTVPIDHFGLVKTKYADVFRFGAQDADSFNFSDREITALDSYLAGRDDKSKLLLVASHYPIDDGINTATNAQGTLRNANNATSVSAILEKYDQPILFLWSHNHDFGPDTEGEILKDYGTGYKTLNTGAVGYKKTEDYAQGINMTLGSNGRLVDIEMMRYDMSAIATTQFTARLKFPTVEPFTGTGTNEDPFLISSAANLRYLAMMVNNGVNYKDTIFEQTEDINLSGENWKPIGKYVSSSSPNYDRNRDFSGTYDGKGHIISGLTINQDLVGTSIINKGYGLFGYLTGTVRNLGLTNVDIRTQISGDFNMYAGGIAGYVGYYDRKQGFIQNCYTTGMVSATAAVRCDAGGLAGYYKRGVLDNSYSSVQATITGGRENSGAGGLTGFIDSDGSISKGYWNTDMTTIFGEPAIAPNVEKYELTTAAMKAPEFVAQLNANVEAINPSSYFRWMSDQYAGLNNGYPIHEREVLVAPIITTDPPDTSALGNSDQAQVTITSVITASSIWYTTDGSDPAGNGIQYTSPFAVSTANESGETINIKAVTTNGNGIYSPVAEKVITFKAKVVPTPPSGGVSSGGSTPNPPPPPIVTPPAVLFPMPDVTDVAGHWAESGIRKAFGLGFTNGYPDMTFRPDGNITRAEFLTMLVKALNLTSTKTISWSDVDRHWAKEQIQIAAQNGIVEGFNADRFGPNQAITREQMAVMLVRAIKLSVGDQKNNFRDGKDISNWAVNEIGAATQWKLIQGYEDSTFRPQGPATRAEAVEIIIRALSYQESLDQRVTGTQ